MLDHGQHFRSPEFEDARKEELWTETKAEWLKRLEVGRYDADRLSDLCRDIEAEVGTLKRDSYKAWVLVCALSDEISIPELERQYYAEAVAAIEEMEMPHD